ncbi:FGGY-family carbohydrate kinase [Egbenema bharatensis]|uniref:FGGY-family carbohydrate kinase n=1 Tax=Egbenema bharatensis TaxID=3463334 RepID=UPI003A860D12
MVEVSGSPNHSAHYLGIDFGTSGARAIVMDGDRQIQSQITVNFTGKQDGEMWRSALFDLLIQIPPAQRQQIQSIAIDGTSSTVLLCDHQGHPLTAPMLYNDSSGAGVLDQVKAIAPPHHTVISTTSSLTKLLWLTQTTPLPSSAPSHFLHQADWLSFLLHGKLGASDYHNALKLGYDVENLCYPDWLQQLEVPVRLPEVFTPGTPIAPVSAEMVDRFGFPSHCLVCAGTTDSIAAFLASGASSPGEAVSSLGSTLVLKLLSRTRVDDARYGIYSHRLGDLWLVGGASNTGGAVLKMFFTDEELGDLSPQIPSDRPSPLDYYPLPKPGERFPINDPNLLPQLEPSPENPVEFLHGILESIARIEARGYHLLQELGATPLTQVYTAGGGAKNLAWTKIRSRHLGIPVTPSEQTEAAYGTALLASSQV